MVRAHSPDGTAASFAAAVKASPEGEEARVYRTWMRDVLQPLNERAAALVVDVSGRRRLRSESEAEKFAIFFLPFERALAKRRSRFSFFLRSEAERALKRE